MKIIYYSTIILMILFFPVTDIIADSSTHKKVLVINSYHQGYFWSDKIVSGLRSVIEKWQNSDIYYEYMDSKRILGIFTASLSVIIIILLISVIKINRSKKEREKLIHKLQNKLNQIKTLHGLLPICSNCKKIRDDEGYWNQIEDYIAKNSEAEFTHSLCDDCQKKLYPQYFK